MSIGKDVLKSQLKKGTQVEMEHTKSKKVAKKIALDHLHEHPKYYDYLAKAEQQMKKTLKWHTFGTPYTNIENAKETVRTLIKSGTQARIKPYYSKWKIEIKVAK